MPAEAAAREPANRGEFGLIDLVEEFTALRHELKLQTKSARGLQEQTEALLPALRQAIEQFRSVEPKEAQAAWTAGKPLAEALADLDEALDRGRGEIEKARRAVVEEPADALDGRPRRSSSRGNPGSAAAGSGAYHEQVRRGRPERRPGRAGRCSTPCSKATA